MERRKHSATQSSSLPFDYLQMVSEIFSTHFDSELKAFCQLKPESRFEARGEIYSDELILSVSLITEGALPATTIYASCDFDPKASTPSAQDLLSSLVDAIASIYGFLFNEKGGQLEALASDTLGPLEDVPFEWTEIESDRKKVFVKVDKSNPLLDQEADEWLKKHDPDLIEQQEKEEIEMKNLFVTGPKSKNPGSGTIH
jgi:hypothetical protein